MQGSIYVALIYVIYRLLSFEELPFICDELLIVEWYFVMIRSLFASTQDNTRVTKK